MSNYIICPWCKHGLHAPAEPVATLSSNEYVAELTEIANCLADDRGNRCPPAVTTVMRVRDLAQRLAADAACTCPLTGTPHLHDVACPQYSPDQTEAVTEVDVLQFIGWLTADIPELHNLETTAVAESWKRFRGTQAVLRAQKTEGKS